MIVKLPERFAFVRKSKTQTYHIAVRNIHSKQPIHLASCSFDVGENQPWPDVATEADAARVCKKCANSVFGFRWYAISRGLSDTNEVRSGA